MYIDYVNHFICILKTSILEEIKMNNKIIMGKNGILLLCTWIINKLGLLLPAIILFILLMILDYISGILAAKKEALENEDSHQYGLNSKKGILGIYKKIGYMLTIVVAVCIDYLLFKFSSELGLKYSTNTFFGLVVTIWLIINEILSILENINRMGCELPNFLSKLLSELKKDIDDTHSTGQSR